MVHCDVAVIGAGPGGYVAAIRAAQLGGRVVAIEREELGGVCLNWGCIPTKTLIHTAHLYHKLQHADRFGLDVSGLGVNLKALVKRKNEVVKSNKAGIRNLFKANGIQLVQGNAKVTGPHSILVGDEQIEANAIIIATGSSPAQLPGLETDGKRVITSTEALDLEELPKSAVIVGAGAIGAEFASMWNAFGVNVTLVEMLPRVLPNDDEEISQRMGDLFKKRKIDVRTETTVKKLDVGKKGVHVEFDGAKAGAVDADLVLVGIGRRYHSEVVSETPGLGVELGQRGKINVNERMETTVPSIYAIGDVVGKTMLAHGASAEGLVAAANAMGASKTMDYRVVPACTFTSPEVASVGLTETKAKAAGIETKVGRFNMMASGRAHTMGETDGMVKIIGNAKTDQVIGVHIMGPEAGELIAAAALAIRLEATVEDIAHTIHTHPTLAETVMEAAEDYYGAGIHTPPSRSA
ncbi:MAG: dihydrolipoyl dehydrogenase [Candidatus Hydrogenedentales bacterium]